MAFRFEIVPRLNIKISETFLNKVLREIANASWSVSNLTIRRDLKVETVESEIYLHQHQNVVSASAS